MTGDQHHDDNEPGPPPSHRRRAMSIPPTIIELVTQLARLLAEVIKGL